MTDPENCQDLEDKMNSSEDKECMEETSNCPQESEAKAVDVVNAVADSNVQEPKFYGKAQKYWSEVPATVNGMLGGLGYISAIDIQGSNTFLREIRVPGNKLALDCGAGIGRVTRNLLIPRFHCVDIVEQDPAFANKAREYCTTENQPVGSLGEIYNVGLQKFTPTKKYDLIWSQWVLGHLTELDLVDFFRRVRQGLAPDGFFVIKENVTKSKEIIDDDEDSSVTRPLEHYDILLKTAGFRIVRKVRQQNFPKDLYPVYMIACKPLSVA